MKIVLNKCFGGFGLSFEGVMYYAKLKGIQLFGYTQTKYSFREGINEYTKINGEEESRLLTYYFTTDLGETIEELPNKGFFNESDIERTDPCLVQTVEDLGNKSFGSYAKLCVVEIPDNVPYEITEYDGQESVEEPRVVYG